MVNEYFNPSVRADGTGWVEDYILAMLGLVPGNAAGDSSAARSYADRFMIDQATGQYVPSFQDTVRKVRNIDFQGSPPGASLFSDSQVLHTELYYNFKQIKWADIIVGGNFRQYRLFSNATIFDEAPDDPNDPQRIITNTFGSYVQVSKTLWDKYKLTGSLRYDNMDDFKGNVTPRLSLVYSPDQNHNFRINFQTGFRFPEMTAQFLYFPNPTGIILGGVPSTASRYGVYNGGSWTASSYADFIGQGGTINPNTGAILSNPGNVTLETADFSYLTPEKLWSYEVGYKGIIADNLYVDLSYYYTSYKDFVGFIYAVNKVSTTRQGQQIDVGTLCQFSLRTKFTRPGPGLNL